MAQTVSAPIDALTDQDIAGKSLPETALLDDDVDINVSGHDVYGEDFDTPEIERLREVRLPDGRPAYDQSYLDWLAEDAA